MTNNLKSTLSAITQDNSTETNDAKKNILKIFHNHNNQDSSLFIHCCEEILNLLNDNHSENNASLFLEYCDYLLQERNDLAFPIYQKMLNLTANSSESVKSLFKSKTLDFLKADLNIIDFFESKSEQNNLFNSFLLARTGNKFTSYKNNIKSTYLLNDLDNNYWNDYEKTLVLINLNTSIGEDIIENFLSKASLSKEQTLDFMERLPNKFLQVAALYKLPQSLRQDKDFIISLFQSINYHSEDIPQDLLDDVVFVINVSKGAKNNRILLEHFQDIDSELHPQRVIDIVECFQEMKYINSKISQKSALAELEDSDRFIAQKYLVKDNNYRDLHLDNSKLFLTNILKMYTTSIPNNPLINNERNLSIWNLLHTDSNVSMKDITQFYLDCKIYENFNKSNIHEEDFKFIKLLTKTNILSKSDNDECYFKTFELATEQFKVFIQQTLTQKFTPLHEAITIVDYFDGNNLLMMSDPKLTHDEFVEFMLQIPHPIIEKIVDDCVISKHFLSTIGDNYLKSIDSDIFLENLKTLNFEKKLMLENSTIIENIGTVKARKF